MTVDFMYQLANAITNKNVRGDLGSVRFNLYIQQAENSFITYLLGEYQKYQPGRPVPPVMIGMTRRIRQSLSPLIPPPVTVNIDNVTGVAPFPEGHLYTDVVTTMAGKGIRYAEQTKLPAFLESTIDPVETNPIYLIQQNGFQFYPFTLGTAKVSYVKQSPGISWGTGNENGREVYDVNSSKQPVWADIDCLEILTRALRMMGVSIQFNDVQQYANEIKATGQ